MTHKRLLLALLAGALFAVGLVLFGIGWGLAGYRPGPALASVLTGGLDALAFVAALAAGMWAAVRLTS